MALAIPVGENASAIKEMVDNGGIEVAVASGNWATGDSPLKIRCFYRVIRKASLVAIA